MEPVRPVGQGFFPLDEELDLLAGSLTPSVQEHLTHLASWMPFRRAAQMLTRLLGVQVSEATIRRQTLAAGACYEQQQTAESQVPLPHDSSASSAAAPQRLVLSADGAYVGLIKGEWAEVRTLVIAEVEEPSSPQQEVQTHTLSYFSRMRDAATFTDLAEVETRRRSVLQAKQVCAITDGADWLQAFLDVHRSDALRLLDFPHAAQRFGLIAEAYEQHGQPLPTDWGRQQCHDLKHLGAGVVLERLRALPELAARDEHLRSLEKREALMQYPAYQAAGWPIGSGIVESANKVVMQARLKGAGMRWEPAHVNPLLALRTAICNDRWDEAWSEVETWQRQQRALKRQRRTSPRLHSLISSLFWLLLQSRPPTSLSPRPVSSPAMPPAATLPGSSHPSASHPWKRRLISRPKLPAKK